MYHRIEKINKECNPTELKNASIQQIGRVLNFGDIIYLQK